MIKEGQEKEKNNKRLIEHLRTELDQLNTNSKSIEELKNELYVKFCLKEYLEECDPAYCSFRITNSCEYIKILRSLNRELTNIG
jgi:hypothetical protein